MPSRLDHDTAQGFPGLRVVSRAVFVLALLAWAGLAHPRSSEAQAVGSNEIVSEALLPVFSGDAGPDESVPMADGAEWHADLDSREASNRSLRLFADALYWTVREGSAENWAQVITPLGSGTNVGTNTLVDAPFEWNAGFRVGLERQRDDGGDVSVSYTNFSTHAANESSGEVYSAFLGNFFAGNPDGLFFGPHYRVGTIDWDFHFHSFDVEVGRTIVVDPTLELRPFVGLKAAIIRQSLHSTWQGPIDTSTATYLFDSATEDVRQDFWGIGPSLGTSIRMPLCRKPKYSLTLFGIPSGSLMFGHWTFRDQYQNDGPTSTTVPIPSSIAIDTSPITGAATMLRGVLGLEWTQRFSTVSTTVRLGYEAQVWLNQMQMYSYNMGRLNNLASLQGGFFELCVRY